MTHKCPIPTLLLGPSPLPIPGAYARTPLTLLPSSPPLLSSSLYKAPWARVLVYGLGHKVKRNGQLNLIEAVCYPRDASPANTGLTPPPTANQYPSVILSTDKVHIKLGRSLN